MKHNNRQKVEANAVLPKNELETAEEALREALRDARGYVYGAVQPRNQSHAIRPPLSAKHKPPHAPFSLQARANAAPTQQAPKVEARAEQTAGREVQVKAEAYAVAGAITEVVAPMEAERDADLMAWVEDTAAAVVQRKAKLEAETAQEAELVAEEMLAEREAEADADRERRMRPPEEVAARAEVEEEVEAAISRELEAEGEAKTGAEAGAEAGTEARVEAEAKAETGTEAAAGAAAGAEARAEAGGEAEGKEEKDQPRAAQRAGRDPLAATAEKERRRCKSLEWANSLPERRWKMSFGRSATTATTGDGLYEGLDWLSNAINSPK